MKNTNDIYSAILEHGFSDHTVVFVLEKMRAQGRSNEAMKQCTRFLQQYPHNAHLRRLMVELYLENGFIGLAEDELKKLTVSLDELVSPYKAMAEHLAAQGNWTEAEPHLRYYLVHEPEDKEALALLSTIETHTIPSGRREAAPPVDFATPTIAELYYEQGEIDAAIATYERVLADNPEHPDAARRLTELRAMASEEEEEEMAVETKSLSDDTSKILMDILKRWLPRIRDLDHAHPTP